MSTIDYKSTKLNVNQALKLMRKILKENGEIFFSSHALKELKADKLTEQDALNVLLSPSSRITDEGELKDGSYRYRVKTSKIVIVIAFFVTGEGIVIVTGWRIGRQ